MRPPKNKWPDTENGRGVLFFAQLMKEQLSTVSFESFRALSLDGIARINECISLLDDVKRGNIPRISLDPVLVEMAWSIDHDLALREICSVEASFLKEAFQRQNPSLPDIRHYLIFMRGKLLEGYKSFLERDIIATFNDQRQRIRLRTCTSLYCSHLLNIGYSRDYLNFTVDSEFFSQDKTRASSGSLVAFFRKMNGEKKKFSLYASVSRSLSRHMKALDFSTLNSPVALPAHVRTDLQLEIGRKFSEHFVTDTIDGLDPYKVATDALRLLRNIKAVALMVAQGLDFDWDQSIYVSPKGSSRGLLIRAAPLTHRIAPYGPSGGRTLRGVKEYSVKLLSSFDQFSAAKIMRAIDSSVSSLSSQNLDNRLITHWSAFEILLATPDPERARIVHYVDLLTPCICIRYARRNFVAVYEELHVGRRKGFTDIVYALARKLDVDQHSAFAAALILEDYRTERDAIFKLIAKNPLALHRAWKLISDFGTPSDFRATALAHENRIRWQLHRIYRARNNIVHAGRAPIYNESLVLNVVEYFRTAVGTIINRASRKSRRANADQIVAEIGIDYKVSLQYLDGLRRERIWTFESLMFAIKA